MITQWNIIDFRFCEDDNDKQDDDDDDDDLCSFIG